MARTITNGVSLYFASRGTGPSIVLVHGGWVDADHWAAVMPLLSERSRVVSYDRRGHSRSERPSGQGSVHEDVADLAALIKALDLAPAFVCGNSFGGLITLRLAATNPHLLRGLTVHEPPAVPLLFEDPRTLPMGEATAQRLAPVQALLEAGEHEQAAELFVDTVALGPGMWGRLPGRQRKAMVDNAPTALDELHDPEALIVDLDEVGNYDGPVLLTHSNDSPPLFPQILDRMAAALPRASRYAYRTGGHVPHVLQPEEYARTVLSHAVPVA